MVKYFFLWFCLLLSACASAPALQRFDGFNNKYTEGENGQVIAFIGEKIGVYDVPYEEWCSTNNICLDQRLNARYKVIKVLNGSYDHPTIDFAVYDHGIQKPFWKLKDRMIIYVGQYNDRLIHEKYRYDVLSPLKGGGFAFCGDPYTWYEAYEIEEHGRQNLIPYNFYPPVTKNLKDFLPQKDDEQDEFQDNVREHFVDGMRTIAPPAYEIKNMVAICRMGMSAEEVVSIRMKYEDIPDRENE